MASFEFFILPFELRLIIWTYMLPPAVIQEPQIDINPSTRQRVISAGAPHPVLLRICRESRIFALKHYTLAFAQSYVDFSVDTLYFHFPTFDWYKGFEQPTNIELIDYTTKASDRAKIRHLAVDCNIGRALDDSPDGVYISKVIEKLLISKLKSYRNVQIFTLVIRLAKDEPDEEESRGGLEFLQEPQLGSWGRFSVSGEFLLWEKWSPARESIDEAYAAAVAGLEKLDIASHMQRLKLKKPEKVPEIRWRFLRLNVPYIWRHK
jgi:hypothetical protein